MGKDTRFKKGEVHNPNGRPKGSFSLTEILRRKLQEVPPEYKDDKKTYAEILIKTMLHKGIIEKNHASQKLIMNYVDGMPAQSVDLTSKGERIVLSETEAQEILNATNGQGNSSRSKSRSS